MSIAGMYLGSAAAMTVLPSLAASLGPGALLTAVGVLGIAWLALWLAVGRDIPHRESVMPMTKADLANPRDSSYDGSFGRISSGSGGELASSFRLNEDTCNQGNAGKNAVLFQFKSPQGVLQAVATPPQMRSSGNVCVWCPLAGGSFRKGRPAPTPWARMLRSAPLWAIVANNFAFHYAFYVIMNWLPTYFDALLGAPLAGLGAAKTLPYLAMFLTSNAGGWLGDSFIHSRRWTVARARKAVNSLGFASAVLALMIMPSATGAVTGIVATTLALATLGVARGGFSVNHMDIAPQYAGVVMGVSNTAGTLAGVVGVAVTGVLIQRGGGAGEVGGWYAAHALSAGVCVAAAAVFAVFARGERVFD